MGIRQRRAVGDGRWRRPCNGRRHRGGAVDGECAVGGSDGVVRCGKSGDDRSDDVRTGGCCGDGGTSVGDRPGNHAGSIAIDQPGDGVGEAGVGLAICLLGGVVGGDQKASLADVDGDGLADLLVGGEVDRREGHGEGLRQTSLQDRTQRRVVGVRADNATGRGVELLGGQCRAVTDGQRRGPCDGGCGGGRRVDGECAAGGGKHVIGGGQTGDHRRDRVGAHSGGGDGGAGVGDRTGDDRTGFVIGVAIDVVGVAGKHAAIGGFALVAGNDRQCGLGDGQRAADRVKTVVGGGEAGNRRRDDIAASGGGGDGRARVADGTANHQAAVAIDQTDDGAGVAGEDLAVVGFGFGGCGDRKNSLVHIHGDGDRLLLVGDKVVWREGGGDGLSRAGVQHGAFRNAVAERTSHGADGVELHIGNGGAVGDGNRSGPDDTGVGRCRAADGQRAADGHECVVGGGQA